MKKKMEKRRPNRDKLVELGYEGVTIFENPDYDAALIGADSEGRAVYDFDKMVECLMDEDGMSYEEAVEFIEYNTIRAIPYFPNGPIVVYSMADYFDNYDESTEREFDVKKAHEGIVKWIRDWFDKNGKDCKAVIGLSGGKDSTICAALLAEALGKDRVIGVAMPGFEQGLNDADKIAEHLGIQFIKAPIDKIISGFHFGNEDFKWSEQAQQNIPPRVRMTMLYAIAQTYNGRVCCCDNASENYLGYSTLYGDDAGSFSPIGNLTVTEVRQIGDELGLPYEWVHKTPDDGLPHSSPDEAKFGFSYETLDGYIRSGICEDAAIREKIDRMHANSQFKRDIIRVPAYNPNDEVEDLDADNSI